MNIDAKGTHLDTHVRELLSKLFIGDMEWLSEQDRSILTENRQAIVKQLMTIFSKQIPMLLRGKTCSDATTLFWALKLARFFEATETFEWIAKLCLLSMEDLENSLGEYFVAEELPYLLADTMTQWSVLKDVIENPAINEFIIAACLDALILSVVKKRIDRSEIIDYFKSLFQRILTGELDDDVLCTHLVSSCTDCWPGECLEEIREAFGLTLVDESDVGIDCVLEDFSLGKDYCIENLQKRIKQHSVWEASSGLPDLSEEEQARELDLMVQITEQAIANAHRTLEELNKGSQRNEICGCGSGRKYKKCCMNKPSPEMAGKTIIEESVISYGPLEDSETMKALPVDVKASILDLYPLLEANPEAVLQKAPEYISKYPDIPMLYNYLYAAYRKTGQPREAIKLMKETVQLFPDYFFGRVEYAAYLLRRGEPEKAHAALGNAVTLSQLYPERKIFHAAEWKAFAYTMSLYWIQKDDFKQANIYCAILKEIAPKSHEITDIQQKMRGKIVLQSIEKMGKDRASQVTNP